MQQRIVQPRGILHSTMGAQKFHLSRHLPSPQLSCFVERYWIIDWDLRGQAPYVQETLPYPCVNVVFEQGRSGVFGVGTGKFARLLEGEGHVFGIKFKPGGFYPLLRSPVSAFTNGAISIAAAFGDEGLVVADAILALADNDERIAIAEAFLTTRLPAHDEHVRVINHIVECIIADPTITKVDDIMRRLNLNTRTMQRIFRQYVGVSPKWVIKRYRLHEAAEQLEAGKVVDWARMAVELGYYDQAHFIKDFKTIVGKTPAEYARASTGGAEARF